MIAAFLRLRFAHYVLQFLLQSIAGSTLPRQATDGTFDVPKTYVPEDCSHQMIQHLARECEDYKFKVL